MNIIEKIILKSNRTFFMIFSPFCFIVYLIILYEYGVFQLKIKCKNLLILSKCEKINDITKFGNK